MVTTDRLHPVLIIVWCRHEQRNCVCCCFYSLSILELLDGSGTWATQEDTSEVKYTYKCFFYMPLEHRIYTARGSLFSIVNYLSAVSVVVQPRPLVSNGVLPHALRLHGDVPFWRVLCAPLCLQKDCEARCADDQFRCHNNLCISLKWLCDGQEDCKTGEDERNCQETGFSK